MVISLRNSAVAFGIQFAMLARDAQGKIMGDVKLYTRQWCGWCVENMVRELGRFIRGANMGRFMRGAL
jgi:hypothetical protein